MNKTIMIAAMNDIAFSCGKSKEVEVEKMTIQESIERERGIVITSYKDEELFERHPDVYYKKRKPNKGLNLGSYSSKCKK